MRPWFRIGNADDVPSPALLIHPDGARANLRRMVAIAGGAERLMPHVKTHKCSEVLRLQREAGARRFKCATLAEAAMLGRGGVERALIALQPAGPAAAGVAALARQFPRTQWAVVMDDPDALEALARACRDLPQPMGIYIDLDIGMGRTGVAPGSAALDLWLRAGRLEGVTPEGLHAYDGHIGARDPVERARACDAAFAPVEALAERIREAAGARPEIIAGGTPTFPIHARRPGVTLSPGTCVLWDAGYGAKLPDLEFEPAAALLTRVISKPGRNRLCLDLGHKAVGSEMAPPRAVFPDLEGATPVAHSEEHLVLETPSAERFRVGDCVYGIPWHICPTVALHAEMTVVEAGRATGRWRVDARDRAWAPAN